MLFGYEGWHRTIGGQLDRVGRSLLHLTKVLAEIEAKHASFATVEDGVSTKGATGKLILHVLGAISEFDRGLIIERTQAGLAAARKRGRIGGRKGVMGPKETKRARALLGRVDWSANDVAAMMKVSRRGISPGPGTPSRNAIRTQRLSGESGNERELP